MSIPLSQDAEDLVGRTAVVVGASAGIGRAIARELAALGASIVWCGRRGKLLDEAIQLAGGTGTAVPADIATEDGCQYVAEMVRSAMEEVDLLVIASGVSEVRRLRDADASYWGRLLSTNLVGPALLVRHLIDDFAAGAVVAMLSSESVGRPYPGLVPYAASKAALEETLRGFRTEHPDLRFARVTVGATDGTDFARDFDPELTGTLFTEWVRAGAIPARPLDPGELGISIARTLAHAVLVPGVDVQDIVLRPPGGPMSFDT